MRLAVARRRQGRLRDAAAVAQQGVARFPDSARLIQESAEIALAEQDYVEAEARWREALWAAGDDASSAMYVGLSSTLRRAGRFDPAEATIQEAVERWPDDPRVLRELAEVAHSRGEHALAVERWRHVVSHAAADRPPRQAYVRLAASLRGLRDFEAAATTVEEGLVVHPRDAALARERAEIHMRALEWEAAVAWWERARQWSPAESMPASWHLAHGVSLERCHRLAEALDCYERALAGLQEIDSPWANEAQLTWRFRRDHVRRRLFGNESGDPRLDCLVTAEGPGRAMADAPGAYQAQVTYKGINISGVLDRPEDDSVDVHVNDRVVKTVAVSPRAPHAFSLHLKHPTLATFPPLARVTVTAGGRPLAADGRAGALQFTVPHGDGSLTTLLDDGMVLTKKGTLFDPDSLDGEGARQRLEAYAKVRRFFEDELGAPLFLMYGTLLGYYRDGGFIKGDDDLDVGYVSRATTPRQAKDEAKEVALHALRAGFDVTTRFGSGLMKIIADGVELDVYPIWFFQGLAWGYDAIDADRACYEPPQLAEFHGVPVWIPADPERLLAGTYGSGWRRPDPGFRHVRSADVLQILRQTQLRPSEGRELVESNRRDRADDPTVGRFVVTDDPWVLGGARANMTEHDELAPTPRPRS